MNGEFCFGLGCGAMVWLPLAVIAIGWVSTRLRTVEDRLRRLERSVADAPLALPARTAGPADAAPIGEAPAAEREAPPPRAPPPRATPPRPAPPARPPWVPPSPERVALWLAAGLGGLMLVLAALFALGAAIDAGWLGPAARVAGGLVGASVAWVGGSALRRTRPVAGSAIAGAGVGAAYGALYAASGLYGLIPESAASAAMVAVTILAAARAAVLDDRFVAWLSLVGGLLTPVLVSTGANRPVSLFVYLALLAAGMAATSAWRRWPDLLVGTAIGVAAMHGAWAAAWYTADQTQVALLGVLLVGAPFVATAALSRDATVRAVATSLAALLVLLAGPWVVPVDTSFVDPRSGLWTTRTEPLALPLGALGAALVPVPLALAVRWRRSAAAWIAGVPGALLAVWFAASWTVAGDATSAWLVGGAVGGAALGAAIALGSAEAAVATVPWWAAAGLALSLVSAPPVPLAFGVVALVAAGAAIARGWRSGAVPLVALGAVGLPLWTHAVVDENATALAGALLVALAVGVPGVATARWSPPTATAGVAAALAPVVAFFPAYGTWVRALGGDTIGLVPVLLAALTLLAAAVWARREAREGRPPRDDDFVVALFALVVLLGVAVAVPLQLRARWVTVGWAIEAAALAAVANRLRHPILRWSSVALAVAVTVRLVANPWALGWGGAEEGWPVLNWTLYAWGVPLVCLLASARWLPAAAPTDPLRHAPAALGAMAALVGFALVNVEVSHAFQERGALALTSDDRLQSMVRSATWAAYGVGVLGLGLWRDQRMVRLLGFGFVLVATLKGFTLDLWDLRGFVRVGSLAALAVALILAAVVFERLVIRGARPKEGG